MTTINTNTTSTTAYVLTPDTTGTLVVKTGSGAGTTAMTLDASQNATFAGTVSVPTGAIYPLVTGSIVNTTSGTSVEIGGIPSTAKRVTLMMNGVSTSGTVDMLIQLGTASSIENTGYIGQGSTTGNNPITSTAGFPLYVNSAAHTFYGLITFVLFQASTNTWVCTGMVGQSSNGSSHTTEGVKPLSGALTRINLTTTTAISTFDAGSINIMWE